MKRVILCTALSLFAVSTVSALELNVTNKSKADIHHLYLSDANSKDWGPDQLGSASSDVVDAGSAFKLTGIKSGTYDVKIATADGTECEVDDVDFKESKEWVITESMLAKCGG